MSLNDNYSEIQSRIRAAETLYHRPLDSVRLLAVSKTQSLEKIQTLIQCGQKDFGENYLDESVPKIIALVNEKLVWHFIGAIQSNKTKQIAQHFSWVHSVDRIKIAERLNNDRPDELPPLNICIQINISNEVSKSGISPNELLDFSHELQQFPKLKLRGLMILPQIEADFNKQFTIFEQTAALQKSLIEKGLELDTLSMGMSNDFEAAIAAGSTCVRIGTALFGHREKK